MDRVLMKAAGASRQARDHRLSGRSRRLGELCALALLALSNLALYLFCDRYLDGMRQCIVQVPLHLLVLLAAQHILFEAKRDE